MEGVGLLWAVMTRLWFWVKEWEGNGATRDGCITNNDDE